MNAKSILSISSNNTSDCYKIEIYLQKCGITSNITQNKIPWNKYNSCHITFPGRNIIVDKKLWFNLQTKFNFDCTYLKTNQQFRGHIR